MKKYVAVDSRDDEHQTKNPYVWKESSRSQIFKTGSIVDLSLLAKKLRFFKVGQFSNWKSAKSALREFPHIGHLRNAP